MCDGWEDKGLTAVKKERVTSVQLDEVLPVDEGDGHLYALRLGPEPLCHVPGLVKAAQDRLHLLGHPAIPHNFLQRST